MEKTKVLLVGENPVGSSGNSGMFYSILSQINRKKYDFTCLTVSTRPIDSTILLFKPLPFSQIDLTLPHDLWGSEKLLDIVSRSKFDILLMIGIDVWRYFSIHKEIAKLSNQKGFKWGMIFPYDLQYLRKDWLEFITVLDFPCVYSQYGFEMLKEHVPNLRYFRPNLREPGIWHPFDKETRKNVKKRFFSDLSEERFIFSFVGQNQFRKDPVTLLKAFSMFKKEFPDKGTLYFHFNLNEGVYDLKQMAEDLGLQPLDLFSKRPDQTMGLNSMPSLYNASDCLVNCTMQEGLSWTVIESMLCGTPVIASDSTAHPELFKSSKCNGMSGYLVRCRQDAYIPSISGLGQPTWVEAKKCKAEDIFKAMLAIYTDKTLREMISQNGIEVAKEWLEDTSNINDLLHDMTEKKATQAKTDSRKQAVLFCQHSAAGDIFMTTRCLKGIKERHSDLPLHYMTQKKYFDILENNPYIDEIVPWTENLRSEYLYSYNPHGDVILPGHWGRNCNSILSDFYWKILDVEPDDFFIDKVHPFAYTNEGALVLKSDPPVPLMIVHTTGGDSQFRTYKYMKDVCDLLKDKYFTIQVGSENDYPAESELDLRGKLSFRETAWVMSQADIAVTVDSFVSHLAGALGISQVCLFGSGNHLVVRPNQISGTLICMVPDYVRDCKGLGPCSAAVRDCPAPCTGKHDPLDIVSNIKRIEKINRWAINTDRLFVFRKEKGNEIVSSLQ